MDKQTPETLLAAVKALKPTALIGVSAQGGAFSEEIIKEMATNNAHPLIFALSNPTSKAECTAKDAYTWTNGQAVFASGSPFDPVTLPNGRHFVPGQGNNAYIFPGVGLGVLAAQATKMTDEDFLVAARALASTVTADRLAIGCAYPDLKDIREVSVKIAVEVAQFIHKSGRSSVVDVPTDADATWWKKRAEGMMYTPSY
jgi:malate dehydrogenase (oxaloacetate-decarboxylating)(NADP+)